MGEGLLLSLIAAAITGATLLVDHQYHAYRRRIGVTQLEKEVSDLSTQLANLDLQKRSLDEQCMTMRERVRDAETKLATHAVEVANAARHWD